MFLECDNKRRDVFRCLQVCYKVIGGHNDTNKMIQKNTQREMYIMSFAKTFSSHK